MKLVWFRRFLQFEHGIPPHNTFGRVFAVLDMHEFLTCLQAWVACFQSQLKAQGVAIDGKTLRRSLDTAAGHAALHVVSAWAPTCASAWAKVAVDEPSNEIAAMPRLQALLELTGAVFTLDSMHCQTDTAAAIRQQQADYLLTVKQNQPKLWQELLDTFIAYEKLGR